MRCPRGPLERIVGRRLPGAMYVDLGNFALLHEHGGFANVSRRISALHGQLKRKVSIASTVFAGEYRSAIRKDDGANLFLRKMEINAIDANSNRA